MRARLEDWRLYIGWAVVVPLLLVAAYRFDPYVFGFTVLALGVATGVLCMTAALLVIARPTATAGNRLATLVALLVAVAAITWAWAVLGRFNWA